jgi:transmembrane sensor
VNATVDPDSAIHRQARDWALAVFGEPFPPERARALGQWLDADPRHAAAYAEAERLMLALGEFDALATATRPRRRPVAPWLWPAGAALAAGLVAAAVLVPRPAAYVAGPAIRSIALRDGSTVLLAPGSALRAAAWWSDRRYVLERGEALFDVRHAEGRRFEVAAGPARVSVLGTRFDVRNGRSGEVRVAVQRGAVAVTRAGAGRDAAAPRLGPGDVVTLGPATLQRSQLADPAQVGAWTSGQLAYASAPLGDILADLNAYGRVRTVVASPADRLRLTASFRVDQGEAFIAGLPALLPVIVETRPDGTRLVTARRPPAHPRP